MLFSIIIPVYNVEKYLRESIDSVLIQDEKDLEIILVDDGSTDSSGKICDEYQSDYPEIIRVIHKSNEGLLLTRRRGIKEAKGEWIIHLDSDDYMMPGVLTAVHKAIVEYDSDLIIGKIAYGAEDGKSIDFYSKISFHDGQIFEEGNKIQLYKHFFLDGYISAICQKIARKDIVDVDADYSQWFRVSVAEDILQSMPILYNSKKCVYLDKVLLYYRHNAGSITKKKNADSYMKGIFSLLDVFGEERKYYKRLNIPDAMTSDIATKHFRQLCDQTKQICKTNEQRKKIKTFLLDLYNNETWRWLFRNSNKTTLGKFSKICYFLISRRLTELMVLFCRAL